MHYISDDMLIDAIREQPATFDTHDVEKWMMGKHPVAVAEEILQHRSTAEPLRQFSSAFSTAIAGAMCGQLRKLDKIESHNLGGRVSSNQRWSKPTAND